MAKRKKQEAAQQPSSQPVEVVVFEDPGKRRVKKKQDADESAGPAGDSAFDWHRARYEVFRFGITGLEDKKQTNAKVSLAVKLVAKVSFLCQTR